MFLVLTDAEAVYDPNGWPDKKVRHEAAAVLSARPPAVLAVLCSVGSSALSVALFMRRRRTEAEMVASGRMVPLTCAKQMTFELGPSSTKT